MRMMLLLDNQRDRDRSCGKAICKRGHNRDDSYMANDSRLLFFIREIFIILY